MKINYKRFVARSHNKTTFRFLQKPATVPRNVKVCHRCRTSSSLKSIASWSFNKLFPVNNIISPFIQQLITYLQTFQLSGNQLIKFYANLLSSVQGQRHLYRFFFFIKISALNCVALSFWNSVFDSQLSAGLLIHKRLLHLFMSFLKISLMDE